MKVGDTVRIIEDSPLVKDQIGTVKAIKPTLRHGTWFEVQIDEKGNCWAVHESHLRSEPDATH